MKSKTILFTRTFWSGLAARFASCPPRFVLLLTLRKTHSQPALLSPVSYLQIKNHLLATDMVCLPKRSQGGARSAGDMSVGRRVLAVVGLDAHSVASHQTKTDRK